MRLGCPNTPPSGLTHGHHVLLALELCPSSTLASCCCPCVDPPRSTLPGRAMPARSPGDLGTQEDCRQNPALLGSSVYECLCGTAKDSELEDP